MGALLVFNGCAFSVLGMDVALRFFPALVTACFVIPLPPGVRLQMAKPLQLLTAWSTQAVFELLGETTRLSGELLSINGINVTITEGCSGLRLFLALSLAATAFSFGAPLRSHVRLLALLSSFLYAVFCNVLRLVPTVWFYGYQSMKTADSFHDISAWVILPVALLLLAGMTKLLRWVPLSSRHYVLAYCE